MTETNLPMPDLRLSVRRALIGNVTGNLAGLYAREDAENVHIVAYFFVEASESDREAIEDAGGYVAGDYPWGYTYSTEYKLISEGKIDAVPWLFLRAEVYNSPASGTALTKKSAATELLVPQAKLKLSVQQALIGKVTGNLAGLHVSAEAQHVEIVACFFEEPTEFDRECIEDASGMVVADYPDGYTVATEYKLISGIERGAVQWLFLRAEVYNEAADAV